MEYLEPQERTLLANTWKNDLVQKEVATAVLLNERMWWYQAHERTAYEAGSRYREVKTT